MCSIKPRAQTTPWDGGPAPRHPAGRPGGRVGERPSDGDAFRPAPGTVRLRVVLLTSDDPQHRYLRRLLACQLGLVATLVEPGRAQQRRLWRRHRYRDALYRSYH